MGCSSNASYIFDFILEWVALIKLDGIRLVPVLGFYFILWELAPVP